MLTGFVYRQSTKVAPAARAAAKEYSNSSKMSMD